MPRVLAIDYGEKRLGLALSDETKLIAQPLPFLAARKRADLLPLLKTRDVEKILLGLPKNLAGQESGAAARARAFGAWLAQASGLPVEFLDERFTTRQARAMLKSAAVRGAGRFRNVVDSLSAQILLQTYLRKLRKTKN